MKNKSISKALKITGIVIGVLLLILAGVVIYLDMNAEKIAEDLLEKEYQDTEISRVYEIGYGNIRLSLFTGDLVIKDLEIKPRASFYEAGDSLRLAFPLVFSVRVPRLSISGINENLSLQLEKVELEKISFSRPDITMIDHLTKSEKNRAKQMAKKATADTSAKTQLKKIMLDHFILSKGKFTFVNRLKNREVFTAGQIDVDINGIELEPGHIVRALVTRTFQNAEIRVADIEYPVPNGFYEIRLGEVVNNSGERSIEIHDFELIPKYDKFDFGKEWGKQTDRMEVKLPLLRVEGLDTEKLAFDNAVIIDRILIEELYLNAFRNKNIPFDYSRYPDYPQQALAKLDMDLNVKKLEIKKSKVLYEEVQEGGHTPGQVPISDIYGTITNISNMPQVIRKSGPMRWDLQGKFFDAGLLKLNVNFTSDINAPDFTFNGTMSDMDMAAFNSMTEPAAHIRITEGEIDSLTFQADAGPDFSEGIILMKYQQLEIKPLGKNASDESNEKSFLGAIANMVIHKNNPPSGGNKDAKHADIFFKRDVHKSIFNYLAKSLISGIKHTILPNLSSPKKQYEREQRREERREEREGNREERRKEKRERK